MHIRRLAEPVITSVLLAKQTFSYPILGCLAGRDKSGDLTSNIISIIGLGDNLGTKVLPICSIDTYNLSQAMVFKNVSSLKCLKPSPVVLESFC